jgi:hypothetical protein
MKLRRVSLVFRALASVFILNEMFWPNALRAKLGLLLRSVQETKVKVGVV